MDRYSKVILTVIAVALSALALQNAGVLPATMRASVVSSAMAASLGDGVKVQICAPEPISNDWQCVRVIDGRLLTTTKP